MSDEPPLNQDELNIVRKAKRTMMILGQVIKERDDMPQLNADQETKVICQLGPAIFDRLMDAE